MRQLRKSLWWQLLVAVQLDVVQQQRVRVQGRQDELQVQVHVQVQVPL